MSKGAGGAGREGRCVWLCIICKYEVELDDVIEHTETASGHAICVRCFYRTVDETRTVPPWLRRQVEQAAAPSA